MISPAPSYHGYRFPPDIIAHAVWLYFRFSLSFRDVEDLLAQRGVTVTYETVRRWCRTFGSAYVRRLRQRRGRLGDTWHLDELFVTLNGRHQYLWRAVDEDGDLLDILVQSRRNRRAAVRFFRKLLKRQGCLPRRLITDKLRSYPAAQRLVMPSVPHCTDAMRTTAPKCRINRPDSASGRCAASSHPPICNTLRPCTASSTTFSGLAATSFDRLTTACSEAKRSSSGRR